MLNKLKALMVIVLFLGLGFLFYSYFWGRIFAGADAPVEAETPPAGLCPACVTLEYKRTTFAGVRLPLVVKLQNQKIKEVAPEGRPTLTIKNEEKNLEKALIALMDETGKLLSEEKEEYSSSLSLSELEVESLRFMIKGPELPAPYRLSISLTNEKGELIFAKTITILQRSLFNYKVSSAVGWQAGREESLTIVKWSAKDSFIKKYAYCVRTEETAKLEVFYTDRNREVKAMQKEKLEEGFEEYCMPEQILDKEVKNLTVTLLFKASESLKTTITIYDQTYYPLTPVAKRTLIFE